MVNVTLPFEQTLPRSLLVTAITKAKQAVITVSPSNDYIAGQLVRLTVPHPYGMFQANGRTVEVVDSSGLTITVDMDSRLFDNFAAPNPALLPTPSQPASLAPAGARNIYNVTVDPFRQEQ